VSISSAIVDDGIIPSTSGRPPTRLFQRPISKPFPFGSAASIGAAGLVKITPPGPGELLASHFEVGQPFFEVNGQSLEYAASYFRLTQNVTARGGTATYPSPGDPARRSGIEHDDDMFKVSGTIEHADAIAR
jgi:hypothetical protein